MPIIGAIGECAGYTTLRRRTETPQVFTICTPPSWFTDIVHQGHIIVTLTNSGRHEAEYRCLRRWGRDFRADAPALRAAISPMRIIQIFRPIAGITPRRLARYCDHRRECHFFSPLLTDFCRAYLIDGSARMPVQAPIGHMTMRQHGRLNFVSCSLPSPRKSPTATFSDAILCILLPRNT